MSSSAEKSQGIVRGTAIVSSITALSRVLGFARDLLLARLFGAGMLADAFFVAYRIPNLLRSFVAEGALTSAFVPVFSYELSKGKEAAQKTLSDITGLLLTATIILSCLGVAFAPEITALFAPGFQQHPEKFDLCTKLLRIMFPYIIFVSIVAMLGGALNSVKIFGTAAMAQVGMNICLIAGALVAGFTLDRPTETLAVSVLIGGAVQVLIQLPALKRAGYHIIPSFHLLSRVVRELLTLMLPALIGAAVYQLSMFLNTVLASFLENGSVSWLFYADRVVQLPIGIFSIALASVLLPALSKAAADRENELFARNVTDALRFTTFVILPPAFGLFYLADPIVTVLFERGAFSEYDTRMTALAMKALAVGLWGISCHTMVVRGFLARKDTWTPTLIGIITLGTSFTLALLFMGGLRPGQSGFLYEVVQTSQYYLLSLPGVPEWLTSQELGHAGLALASSLSATLGFVLLSLVLNLRIGGVDWQALLVVMIKTLLSSSGMIFALSMINITSYSPLVSLIVAIPVGILVFLVIASILRIRELQETRALVSKRLRRT